MERTGMVTPSAADPRSSQVPAAYFPPYPPFFPPFENPYRPDFHEHFRQHLLHPFPHPHQLYAAAAATEQQQHGHPFAFWPPCPRSPDVAAACGSGDPFRTNVGLDLQQQQQRAGEEAYYGRSDGGGVAGAAATAGDRSQKQLMEDGANVNAASSPYYPFYAYNCAAVDPAAVLAAAGDASSSNSTTETSSTHAASTPGAFSYASLPTAAAAANTDADAAATCTSAFYGMVEDPAVAAGGAVSGETCLAASSLSPSTTAAEDGLPSTSLQTAAAPAGEHDAVGLPLSSSAADPSGVADSLGATAATGDAAHADDKALRSLASEKPTGEDSSCMEAVPPEAATWEVDGASAASSTAPPAALHDASLETPPGASGHSRASDSGPPPSVHEGEQAAPGFPEGSEETISPTLTGQAFLAAAVGASLSDSESETGAPAEVEAAADVPEENSSADAAVTAGTAAPIDETDVAATVAEPNSSGRAITEQHEDEGASPQQREDEQQHQPEQRHRHQQDGSQEHGQPQRYEDLQERHHSQLQQPPQVQHQQQRRFAVRVPQLRWTAESPTDMGYLRCFSRVYGKRGEPVVWCKRKGRPWWPGLLVSPLDPFLNPPLPPSMKRKFLLLQQQQQHARTCRGRNKERRLLFLCCGTWRYWWVAAAGLRDFRAAYEEIAPRVRQLGGLANVAVQQALEECSWRDHPDYNSCQSTFTLLASRPGDAATAAAASDGEDDEKTRLADGGPRDRGEKGRAAAAAMEEEGFWMTENECSTDSEGDPEAADPPAVLGFREGRDSAPAFLGREVSGREGTLDLSASKHWGRDRISSYNTESADMIVRRSAGDNTRETAPPSGVCTPQHHRRALTSAAAGTSALRSTGEMLHYDDPASLSTQQQRQQKAPAHGVDNTATTVAAAKVPAQTGSGVSKEEKETLSTPQTAKEQAEETAEGRTLKSKEAELSGSRRGSVGGAVASSPYNSSGAAQKRGPQQILQQQETDEEQQQGSSAYEKKRKHAWGNGKKDGEVEAATTGELQERLPKKTSAMHAEREKAKNSPLTAAARTTREKLILPAGACEEASVATAVASSSVSATGADAGGAESVIGGAASSSPGRVSVRLSASRLAPDILYGSGAAVAEGPSKKQQQLAQRESVSICAPAAAAARGRESAVSGGSRAGGSSGVQLLHAPFAPEDDVEELTRSTFTAEEAFRGAAKKDERAIYSSAAIGTALDAHAPRAAEAVVTGDGGAAAIGVGGVPVAPYTLSQRRSHSAEQQQKQQSMYTASSEMGRDFSEKNSSTYTKHLSSAAPVASSAPHPEGSAVTAHMLSPAAVGELASTAAAAGERRSVGVDRDIAAAAVYSGGGVLPPQNSSNSSDSTNKDGGKTAAMTAAGEAPTWTEGFWTRLRKQAEVQDESTPEEGRRDIAAAPATAGESPVAGSAVVGVGTTAPLEAVPVADETAAAAAERRGSHAKGGADSTVGVGSRTSSTPVVEKVETTAAASAASLPPAVAALLNSSREQQPQLSKAAAAAAAVAAAAERNAQATTAFANFLQQQQQQQKQLQAEVEAAAAAAAAAVLRGLPATEVKPGGGNTPAAGTTTEVAGTAAAPGTPVAAGTAAGGGTATAAETSSSVAAGSSDKSGQETATEEISAAATEKKVAAGTGGDEAGNDVDAAAAVQEKTERREGGGRNESRSMSRRRSNSNSSGSSSISPIAAAGGSRSRSARSRGRSSASRSPRVGRRGSRNILQHKRKRSSSSSAGFRRGWRGPAQRGIGGRRGYGRRDSSSKSRSSSRSTSRSGGGGDRGASMRRRGPPTAATRRGVYSRDFRGGGAPEEQHYSPGGYYRGRRAGGAEGGYRRAGGGSPSWRMGRRYSSSERSSSRCGARRMGVGCSSSSGEECLSSGGRRFFPPQQQRGRGVVGRQQPQPPYYMQHGKGSTGGGGAAAGGISERQHRMMRQMSSRSRSSSRRRGGGDGHGSSRLSSPAAGGGGGTNNIGGAACRGCGGRSSRSCSRESSGSRNKRGNRGDSTWRWGGGGRGYRGGGGGGGGGRRLSPCCGGAGDMSNSSRSTRQHHRPGGGGGLTPGAAGRGRGSRWGQQSRNPVSPVGGGGNNTIWGEGRSSSRLSPNSSRCVSSSRSVSSSRWQRRRRRSGNSRRSSSSRRGGSESSGRWGRSRRRSSSSDAGKWWRAYNRRGQQRQRGGGGDSAAVGRWRGRRTPPPVRRDSETRRRESGDACLSPSPCSSPSRRREAYSAEKERKGKQVSSNGKTHTPQQQQNDVDSSPHSSNEHKNNTSNTTNTSSSAAETLKTFTEGEQGISGQQQLQQKPVGEQQADVASSGSAVGEQESSGRVTAAAAAMMPGVTAGGCWTGQVPAAAAEEHQKQQEVARTKEEEARNALLPAGMSEPGTHDNTATSEQVAAACRAAAAEQILPSQQQEGESESQRQAASAAAATGGGFSHASSGIQQQHFFDGRSEVEKEDAANAYLNHSRGQQGQLEIGVGGCGVDGAATTKTRQGEGGDMFSNQEEGETATGGATAEGAGGGATTHEKTVLSSLSISSLNSAVSSVSNTRAIGNQNMQLVHAPHARADDAEGGAEIQSVDVAAQEMFMDNKEEEQEKEQSQQHYQELQHQMVLHQQQIPEQQQQGQEQQNYDASTSGAGAAVAEEEQQQGSTTEESAEEVSASQLSPSGSNLSECQWQQTGERAGGAAVSVEQISPAKTSAAAVAAPSGSKNDEEEEEGLPKQSVSALEGRMISSRWGVARDEVLLEQQVVSQQQVVREQQQQQQGEQAVAEADSAVVEAGIPALTSPAIAEEGGEREMGSRRNSSTEEVEGVDGRSGNEEGTNSEEGGARMDDTEKAQQFSSSEQQESFSHSSSITRRERSGSLSRGSSRCSRNESSELGGRASLPSSSSSRNGEEGVKEEEKQENHVQGMIDFHRVEKKIQQQTHSQEQQQMMLRRHLMSSSTSSRASVCTERGEGAEAAREVGETSGGSGRAACAVSSRSGVRRCRRGRGFFNCSSPESRGLSEDEEGQQAAIPHISGSGEVGKRRRKGRLSGDSKSSRAESHSEGGGSRRRSQHGDASFLGCTDTRRKLEEGEETEASRGSNNRRFPRSFLYGWSAEGKQRESHNTRMLAAAASYSRNSRGNVLRQQQGNREEDAKRWRSKRRGVVYEELEVYDVSGNSEEGDETHVSSISPPQGRTPTPARCTYTGRENSRQHLPVSRKRRRADADEDITSSSSSFSTAHSNGDAAAGGSALKYSDVAAGRRRPHSSMHEIAGYIKTEPLEFSSSRSSRQRGSSRHVSASLTDSSFYNNRECRAGDRRGGTAAATGKERVFNNGSLQQQRSWSRGKCRDNAAATAAGGVTSEEEGCITEEEEPQRRRIPISVSPLSSREDRTRGRSRRRDETGYGGGREDLHENGYSSSGGGGGEQLSYAAQRVRTLHMKGRCLPCRYFWKPPGCRNGSSCKFCHDASHKRQQGNSPFEGKSRYCSYNRNVTPYSTYTCSSSSRTSNNSSANNSRSGSPRRRGNTHAYSSSKRSPSGGKQIKHEEGNICLEEDVHDMEKEQQVLTAGGGRAEAPKIEGEEPEEGEISVYTAEGTGNTTTANPCTATPAASSASSFGQRDNTSPVVADGGAAARVVFASGSATDEERQTENNTGAVVSSLPQVNGEHSQNSESRTKRNEKKWVGIPRTCEKDAARAALLSLQQQAMRRLAASGGGASTATMSSVHPAAGAENAGEKAVTYGAASAAACGVEAGELRSAAADPPKEQCIAGSALNAAAGVCSREIFAGYADQHLVHQTAAEGSAVAVDGAVVNTEEGLQTSSNNTLQV